jgi:hypothetical protein
MDLESKRPAGPLFRGTPFMNDSLEVQVLFTS